MTMITVTNFHETYEIYATGGFFYPRTEQSSFVAWQTCIHRPGYPVTAAVLSTQKKRRNETLCSTSIKPFLVCFFLQQERASTSFLTSPKNDVTWSTTTPWCTQATSRCFSSAIHSKYDSVLDTKALFARSFIIFNTKNVLRWKLT